MTAPLDPPGGPSEPEQPEQTVRYLLASIDDARGHLERAQASLATATVWGRLQLDRYGDEGTDGDTTEDAP